MTSLPTITYLTQYTFYWSQVDYQLQVATGKSSLKLLTVHKYEDKASQMLDYKPTHTAMINITDYSKYYSDKLINKTLSLEDVVFKCGHINIQKLLNQQHKIITFLICKVYLGKIGNSNDPDVTQCDSIFIYPYTKEDVFQFNYFLRGPSQYVIEYEVTFTTSDEKYFKVTDYQCSSCYNRIPTIYCRTYNLFFCYNCCHDHHKSKLMSTHQIYAISKINTLGDCKNHNKKLELFCLKCNKYLCQQCIVKGVHHQNHYHPFKDISLLYEYKKDLTEDVVKRPKYKLNSLMINLNVKRKEIEDNFNHVKDVITKKYESALEILNQIYYEKCQMLNSCEIEIKMLTEKLYWSKAFIVFEEKNLKPMHYFESEKKFYQDMTKFKINDFYSIFLSKPDIKLQGDLVVGTNENIEFYREKLYQETSSVEKSGSSSYEKGLASVYKYKNVSQQPKVGDLALMLQNTKMNFFQSTILSYYSCSMKSFFILD